MSPAPHLLRRSPRLWTLGLLAWLALALQAAVALPVDHAVMHGPMAAMAAAIPDHPAAVGIHHGSPDCCGAPASSRCTCPAACAAGVPTLPEGWVLAALPPPAGPPAERVDAAPHRFSRPPLRPPMA